MTKFHPPRYFLNLESNSSISSFSQFSQLRPSRKFLAIANCDSQFSQSILQLWLMVFLWSIGLEINLIIDFLHLFQILPLDQSDKWMMSNPANERSVTHQVKVHWPILLFWFTNLFFEKMEKGVEEIQSRIKKLHYDTTIFDFHYLYLDAGILFDFVKTSFILEG